MKFLLGSNLKAQLGETEVTREADVSGEKCAVTADLPQSAGQLCWFCGEGLGKRHCGGVTLEETQGPLRPLQSWSCAELGRGFGARRSRFKSYLCYSL